LSKPEERDNHKRSTNQEEQKREKGRVHIPEPENLNNNTPGPESEKLNDHIPEPEELNDNTPEPEELNDKKIPKQRVKKVLRQVSIFVIAVVVIVIVAISGFMLLLQHFARTPAQPGVVRPQQSPQSTHFSERETTSQSTDSLQPAKTAVQASSEEILFTIRPGESMADIARSLENSAIITNQYLFMILARYKGYNRKIQAGEYALSRQYTPVTILDMMIKGKVKLHRVTIPEGLNIREVAAVVESAGFGSSYDFMKLATERSFIASLGIPALSQSIELNSLEGYLFPETYLFPAGTHQRKIITAMVARFKKIFIPEWRNLCKESGFTVHQMVIFASIIEKETGNPSERAMISSVFHNRLKIGMRLESDPTVIYGIHEFNGNITRRDLMTVTPYNTYAINGLPEGPIANPGNLSLKAAIFPIKSDFLFFVSRKDTTHQFSRTLEEHNLAVRRYQLNR